MFTSQQRSNLRSIAQNITPIVQVGKGGISENLLNSLSDALEARELIKITVLNNAEEDAKSLAVAISAKLKSEIVCIIGHKIVLYRKSNKPNFKHIEY